MRFHHVSLSVSDIDRSIRFYTTHFGFREKKRFDKPGRKGVHLEKDGMYLELFDFGNSEVGLDEKDTSQSLGIKHFAFVVEDVQAEYARLKAAGVPITEPNEGSIAIFCMAKDPDGIVIEIVRFL